MANGLSALLGLQSPSNLTPGQSGAAYVPNISRNSAKVAALRNFLGLGADTGDISQQDLEGAFGEIVEQQAAQAEREAEAKALPERVRGEYSLAGERVKGQSALEAARARNEAATTERATAREFQGEQGQLNREAIAGRQSAGQQATTKRLATREAGIGQRQRLSQAEGRIRSMEQGKTSPEYPETKNWLDTLKYYTGTGPYDRTTATRATAEKLRADATRPPAGDDEITGIAQQYLQQYGNLDDDALVDTIIQNEPDASPAELDALFGSIQSLRGR